MNRAMSNFYGTEIEIWAGFGPVGNTEKKIGADYEQLLKSVFSCSQGQKHIQLCFALLEKEIHRVTYV